MTYPAFDDELDAFLERANARLAGEPPEELPVALRDAALTDPARARQLTETLWLHRQTQRRGAPQASPALAARVVADLKKPVAIGWARWTPMVKPAAAFVAALAATIVIAVAIDRRMPPADEAGRGADALVSSLPTKTELEVEDGLREAGAAYLALAQDLAGSVRLTETSAAPAPAAAKRQVELVTPPVGRVLRDSTGALGSAGSELSDSVRPITDSAVGAFSFLWKGKNSPSERPSL